MSIFFRSEKKNVQAYCHSFPEYIQYGSCRCHTVYANSIAGFPEYLIPGNGMKAGIKASTKKEEAVEFSNPLSRSVHGCINLIFIILSILFNLFICINLVYFFVFLFNFFIYLNFTYSECNASKGLSHN